MHTKNDCAIEVQTARRLVFFLWSKNDGWIQDCESVWGMNSWVCLIFYGIFFLSIGIAEAAFILECYLAIQTETMIYNVLPYRTYQRKHST